MYDLSALGWTTSLDDAFQPYAPDHIAGRVAVEHRGAYVTYTADGDVWANAAGRLLHHADDRSELPAVGDWVVMRPNPAGRATIDAVLPRTTAFVRSGAGLDTGGQVLASNIDFAWIVAGMTRGLSARRIERFMTVAWNSGAQPVVVLTKADLGEADPLRVAEVERAAIGSPVVVTSSVTGEGLDELRVMLAGAKTAALLGTSGVGKSSLINALVGENVLVVRETDDAAVGRHTSVRRELVCAPDGGMLIDTPGLRELTAWDSGNGDDNDAYNDIEELFGQCRFNDCKHRSEPGCAIRSAITSGDLSADRYTAYLKLQRELRISNLRKRGKAEMKVKDRVRRMRDDALEKADNE